MFDVLLPALAVGSCFAGGVILVFAYMLMRVIHFGDKLMINLPWLRWLTLEEIMAIGCPKFYCQILLPAFYELGHMEVRERSDLSQDDKNRVKFVGFYTGTIELHEFKLTKRKHRKPRKQKDEEIKLAWRPALQG